MKSPLLAGGWGMRRGDVEHVPVPPAPRVQGDRQMVAPRRAAASEEAGRGRSGVDSGPHKKSLYARWIDGWLEGGRRGAAAVVSV